MCVVTKVTFKIVIFVKYFFEISKVIHRYKEFVIVIVRTALDKETLSKTSHFFLYFNIKKCSNV